jgi:hypothetical protein
MPAPAIKISPVTQTVDGNDYTVECDVTLNEVMKHLEWTTPTGYPSRFMIVVKAFALFLPEDFELPD